MHAARQRLCAGLPARLKMKAHQFILAMTATIGVTIASLPAAHADIASFAFVREDGSLQVSGNHIRLYGIYIPPTGKTCLTFIRPMPCGTRASLALDFKISGDFIHCKTWSTNGDGSLTASCRTGDQDLSEWMLQQGWAVALPDAPFAYAAMEKIARSRGLGIWGMPVDVPR